MTTVAAPMLAFNRGVISKTTLARTDIERTRLSAEVMTNFLPKTQGPMLMRPGTKYIGSSLNDTGAAWIEFVASTTQTALLELTAEKMRVWLPSDTGNTWETPVATGLDVLLARPSVSTALNLTDTGWDDLSSGGSVTTLTASAIPQMTATTTNRVKLTASSSNAVSVYIGRPWSAADRSLTREWHDTGDDTVSSLPSWLNVDFDTGAVTGNYIAVKKYSIRASHRTAALDNAPRAWRLLTGNFDTGTYATDTGKWTLEDERSAQIDWSVSEKKTYTPPGADTGTIEARRHWRLHVTQTDTGNVAGDATKSLVIAEIEMFTDADVSQQFILNATARGSFAKLQKRVILAAADRNKEHSLNIHVSRGPLTLRVGSTEGDDDYIRETEIGTGYHNLAFTPGSVFYVAVQNDKQVDRVIQRLQTGDSGTVEITTSWTDTENIRYDQSADVVYVDCDGVRPHKIERRGTGRSWSVVEYTPNHGPFLAGRTATAKLGIGAKYGNTQLYASQAFFKPTQVGALFQITHEGQSGKWALGNIDAASDPITVTGISDTGTPGTTNERRITFIVSGTYSGTITIERSFDGADFGFKRVTSDYVSSGSGADTGSFTTTVDDRDDNVTVWYRARMSVYTSGVATVVGVHANGSVTGTARITSYVSTTEADAEILENFSDTGSSANWREGAWSEIRGYPTAVALHEGRLTHAGGANVWMSVSDDYENFSGLVEGEAGPISRTLGSGPVDSINFLVSLLRLVVGTAGSEITIKASSFDETLTPVNAAAGAFSTQGSAQLRAVKLDSRALFVQRSGVRLYMIGPGVSPQAANDYESAEMTILAPEILKPGVVSVAIQRQPDTRIHCVLSDGTVAILTYEPQEEVLAWSKWVTDTGTNSAVESAMVLPGAEEDRVYYHVRRTIKGVTKRFLERWALESECRGDTGLSWLADCAVSHTDTGGTLTVADFAPHLGGQTIAVWANDTGQSNSVGKDMTPDDTGGTQQLLSLDTGGDLTLTDSGWKHLVGGLSYRADFKSTKLAYGAQGATAMTMKKRVSRLALVLSQTHNNALFVGSDTGHLDPLPRIDDEGAQVDANKIYPEYDKLAFPVDGDWDEDSRLYIRAKSPRPATIMAALPRITTNES